MNQKKALITGITGQDGSYLAELLLGLGHKVSGIFRRASNFNTARIDHLYEHENFGMYYGDLTDPISITRAIEDFKPDEIYNLGAMSYVKVSFDKPNYVLSTNVGGPLCILEYVRTHAPHVKFYQASSSEMFGAPRTKPPFHENSEMRPQSPYGVSKLAAFHLTRNYQEGYGLFATTGILFNHESPRRGETFVTRKITRGVAAILKGRAKQLKFGNVDAVRDWGHSKDYVKAIHLIMQQERPGEYVVATGDAHSIREALEFCFSEAGLDWKKHVTFNDPKHVRPNEVPYLQGDASKIRALGWKPEYDWKSLLREMLKHDIDNFENQPSKYIEM
jgi:GDPmannose 4,6-dehydratase